jgi:hypothetical protein
VRKLDGSKNSESSDGIRIGDTLQRKKRPRPPTHSIGLGVQCSMADAFFRWVHQGFEWIFKRLKSRLARNWFLVRFTNVLFGGWAVWVKKTVFRRSFDSQIVFVFPTGYIETGY